MDIAYILIVLFYSVPGTMTSISVEFNSESTCEVAEYYDRREYTTAICFRK